MTPIFDAPFFRSQFPPDLVIAELENGNDVVTVGSPFNWIAVEVTRSRFAPGDTLKGPVPTDLFVFSRGEPPTRSATKIGGVPYRLADVPWPVASSGSGNPYAFLAQFDFSESKDIMGPLPGDVLVVFAKDEVYDADDSILGEWWPATFKESELLAEVPPPAGGIQVPTLFGARFRTFDFAASTVELPDEMFVHRHITRIRGVKIGGLPSADNSPGLGRFLCQLAAIGPTFDMPYPWCNIATPLTFKEAYRESLHLIDNGLLTFYLDAQNKLSWQFEYA